MAGQVTAAERYTPVPLGEFVSRDIQRRRWAVKGIWAEGTSGIIAGPPKAGKSTVSLELAVTLATGTPFMGEDAFPCEVAPCRVTYIQAENSEQRVRRDLDDILIARKQGEMQPVPNLHDLDGDPLGEQFQPWWTGDGPDLQILTPHGMDLMQALDKDWLKTHAQKRDYVFLDPSYLLASANPNDQGEMMTLLAFLKTVRDESDCGVIVTHQMTDKHREGSPASRMIGSTFLHGWYESAIFTSRDQYGQFKLRCDNLREMGEESSVSVQGLGVGKWFYAASAQGATDSLDRAAPNVERKDTRIERLKTLITEHGDDWSLEQYAEALEVSKSTVSRDMSKLKEASALDAERTP
jgi:DNA-binding transcriptional ArsR family regulator